MAPKLLAALLGAALVLSACSGGGDAAPTVAGVAAERAADVQNPGGVRVVSPEEGARLAAAPDAVILDVRTPAEFAEGHLAGAVNIDMQAPDAVARFADLDPAADYVLYCRSGNRSAQVREHLGSQGFTSVADVDGGILAWEDAGLPTVR